MSALHPWRPKAKPNLLTSFVLDASVAIGWFGPPQATRYTTDMMIQMPFCWAVVPAHWAIQVADWVLRAERQGRATWSRIEAYLIDLGGFNILPDPDTPVYAWADTLALARTHSIPVHDAAYIELALRIQLPLATTDAALTAAATAAGASLFTP